MRKERDFEWMNELNILIFTHWIINNASQLIYVPKYSTHGYRDMPKWMIVGFLLIIWSYYENACIVDHLIVECKFNMILESANPTTAWRLLTTTPSPPLPHWHDSPQFSTNIFKGVNELINDTSTKAQTGGLPGHTWPLTWQVTWPKWS